jgi:two-component system, LuxR family, response regulator FixJ
MSAFTDVYVVDDDETIRSSLTALLLAAGNAPRAYESARDLLSDCDDLAPGCIVTDFRMPVMDGLELLRRLKDRMVPHPVILLSGYGDIRVAVEAFKAGAVDFIQKPYDDSAVLMAVRKALIEAEEPVLRQATRRRFEAALAKLSAREREVMQCVVDGKSNKLIARELGISSRTVEIHRAHLMAKLGSHSIAALVRMAVASNFSANCPTPVEPAGDHSVRTPDGS